MNPLNHIREIPTEDLKLVAIGYPDIQEYTSDDGRDCITAVPMHEPYRGSEAEYEVWCQSPHPEDSRCALCGHRLKYNCVVQHTPTGEFYDIGRECMGNIEHLKAAMNWAEARCATVAKQVAAGKKAARERKAGDVRLERYCEAHGEIAAAFKTAAEFDRKHLLWHKVSYAVTTLEDMRAKVRKYGSLSEKQETFALSLQKQIADRLVSGEDELKLRDARIASGLRAPSGRVTVSGTIISTKYVENDFGGSWKSLIELSNGTRAYGTIPNDERYLQYCGNGIFVRFDAERGDEVELTATFEVSEKDPLFAFYKRPKFHNIGIRRRYEEVAAKYKAA